MSIQELHTDFSSTENFFVEINLYKKKWLINFSYNIHKSNIRQHLAVITRSLETYSTKYNNIIIVGDFNAYADKEASQNFCKTYSFISPIKQPTCFKNPENPSCNDFILTSKSRSLQTKCVVETGLSDFCRMIISVLKMLLTKKCFFPKNDNERLMNSLQSTLKEESTDYSKSSDKFFEIYHTVLLYENVF